MTRATMWLGWGLLLLLAAIAYWPGLSGGFLFDDFVNLPALGDSGPVDDAATFWRYVTSGTADPTGRPLALLSFLLDARDWPADPGPFLRTNLALHLVNASLLFLLFRRLGAALESRAPHNDWAALVGAGLWLLHPLFVSTTLYIVQRQTMLPATFMLSGLLCWSFGRDSFQRSHGARGTGWMACGIGFGTALAILCKANGILLPLLALVVEWTIYRTATADGAIGRRLGCVNAVLLALPSVALLLYLCRDALHWAEPVNLRGWSVGERLLTEPRVLMDYLQLLAVPRSISTGLYNDDYLVSRGLMSPPSTLMAMAALAVLFALGLWLRRRAPDWSLAILFFFAGHLLESTVVPLELYFEHRNYIPALVLFWPVARALARWRRSMATRTMVAFVLLGICALTTWQRAELWGDPERLARMWASQNPDSSRSQATAAIEVLQAGRPQQARAMLDPLWRERPNDLQIALNYVNAACAGGGLVAADATRLEQAFRHADTGSMLVQQWLETALLVVSEKRCPGISLDTVEAWIRASGENTALTNASMRERSLPSLLGLLQLKRARPEEALAHFKRALTADPAPEVAARQVAQLASHGYYEQALRHLDYYESIEHPVAPIGTGMPWLHAKVLEWQDYWPRELSILRGKLEREIAAQAPSAGPARR